MDEEKTKKYLYVINRMIKNGNPKYMSYISKEYMKYAKVSPAISEAIGDMLFKEVTKNKMSPYAIFLHDNGTVCLDAISDVSKISNVSEFVGQVQELSKYDVDFSEVTPEDLILEGDEMIEKLEKELDQKDLTVEDAEKAEEKAESALVKVGVLATIGGAIGAVATGVIAKIKAQINSLKKQKDTLPQNKKEAEENIKQETELKSKEHSGPTFDEICPRVDVDEKKALNEMKKSSQEKNKIKNTDTYGDGDPDGDDLSM